ncbi:MAG: DUF177 domain-containing protein [Pyrinomonadaceae bacterium]|nr:DUF177 domain-containing protein [Pyrinomonadaceae bacterium]
MIIELENIGVRAKEIDESIAAADIGLDTAGACLEGTVRFRGEAVRIDGKAHLRGTVQVAAKVDCSRCLEPIERPIETFFDAIFVSSDMMPEDAETVLADADLDESVAEGGIIDVAETLREQILLDLPDHPVCSETCKGLCPKCGGNRNLIDCKCEENEIDPRWAALRDLK